MSDDTQTPEDDDALAAEYVVGTLPPAERQEVQARLGRDDAFAYLVTKWERLLEGLNEEYGHMTPPARVKAAIDQRLFAQSRPTRAWWAWPVGLVTALVMLIAVAVWQLDLSQPSELQAVLTGEQDRITVSLDQSTQRLSIDVAASVPPEGSTFELWLLPVAADPVSLGTFSTDGVLTLVTPIEDGATLAVSVEPGGGSPTGAPTGPVIAIGVLQDV